jgi:hypothetical protein
VVPSLGEVEPQRVDVTIARAEQVVLLDQAGLFVDEGGRTGRLPQVELVSAKVVQTP